jgi:hypothetical protein
MWALHWGMIKTTGDRRTLTPVETSGPGDSIEVLRSPKGIQTLLFIQTMEVALNILVMPFHEGSSKSQSA